MARITTNTPATIDSEATSPPRPLDSTTPQCGRIDTGRCSYGGSHVCARRHIDPVLSPSQRSLSAGHAITVTTLTLLAVQQAYNPQASPNSAHPSTACGHKPTSQVASQAVRPNIPPFTLACTPPPPKTFSTYSPHHTDLGHTTPLIGNRPTTANTLITLSYWRDISSLHAFAHSDIHRKGWDWWNRNGQRLSHLGRLCGARWGVGECLY